MLIKVEVKGYLYNYDYKITHFELILKEGSKTDICYTKTFIKWEAFGGIWHNIV